MLIVLYLLSTSVFPWSVTVDDGARVWSLINEFVGGIQDIVGAWSVPGNFGGGPLEEELGSRHGWLLLLG